MAPSARTIHVTCDQETTSRALHEPGESDHTTSTAREDQA